MGGTDLSDALGDMWRSVLLFIPTALAFLAILVIGYVLARLVRTLVGRALKRVGFDRAVERSGFGRALRGGRFEPGELCARIAFYAVLLFALQLAFGLWGPNAVSDLLTLIISWLPRAFVAIVILVVAAAIAGAVRDLIGAALGALPYGRLLARAASVFILALGLIAALEQVGIATAVTGPVLVAVLATVAGVIIVGVGGGLIRPMQQRWDTWLERAGAESQVIREHARTYAETRAAEAAAAEAARIAAEEEAARVRAAEEARKAEEARLAEEARKAEEARRAEEARVAREARIAAEEARKAEAARLAAEAAAREKAAAAARAKAAEETRRAEAEAAAARRAEAQRAAEAVREAQAAQEADLARAAREAAEERARAAAIEADSEKTQVIGHMPPPGDDPDRTVATPVPAPARSRGDRPSFVPGFADDEDEDDRTQVLPTRNRSGDTQILPADDEPTDPGRRPRR